MQAHHWLQFLKAEELISATWACHQGYEEKSIIEANEVRAVCILKLSLALRTYGSQWGLVGVVCIHLLVRREPGSNSSVATQSTLQPLSGHVPPSTLHSSLTESQNCALGWESLPQPFLLWTATSELVTQRLLCRWWKLRCTFGIWFI